MQVLRKIGLGLILSMPLCFTACQSIYYDTMEKVGVHKRDIMVDRVKDARDSQEGAKEQFKDALTQFTEVMEFKGGKLQAKYDKLSKAYERSEARANDVRTRIAKVESVSKALFKEWKQELGAYQNQNLRRASEKQYRDTQDKYDELIAAMRNAASRMDPVLNAFRDQVLFLKHNLNSQAIASIQSEATQVEQQVAQLVREMEASIAEADSFIKELGVL